MFVIRRFAVDRRVTIVCRRCHSEKDLVRYNPLGGEMSAFHGTSICAVAPLATKLALNHFTEAALCHCLLCDYCVLLSTYCVMISTRFLVQITSGSPLIETVI